MGLSATLRNGLRENLGKSLFISLKCTLDTRQFRIILEQIPHTIVSRMRAIRRVLGRRCGKTGEGAQNPILKCSTPPPGNLTDNMVYSQRSWTVVSELMGRIMSETESVER